VRDDVVVALETRFDSLLSRMNCQGFTTMTPSAPGVAEPTLTTVSEPAAPPVPRFAAFFGGAQPSEFDVDGDSVGWDGDPDDWGLRRMILHYAHLCAAAGGVDAFLIGSELRGVTQVSES
jgi:hypothetical protein